MNRRTMTAAVLAAPVLLTVAAFGAEHPNKVITKLAKEGNANAQVSLGQMYVLGLGVPQDHAQAVKWYTLVRILTKPPGEAAHPETQRQAPMNRRTMTAAVLAAPVLLTVAAFGAEHPNKVITKLAKEGNANAQVSLGQMYVLGLGVPQDHAQAVKWYTLAAEQGHARAQYTLGRMYATAHGVPQDYRKAAKWFRKAAEQGQPDSQAWLGALFAAGRGIPQNLIEAHASSLDKPRLAAQGTTCVFLPS